MWHDYAGNLVSYGKIAPRASKYQSTYATHPWSIKANTGTYFIEGKDVWVPTENDKDKTVHIGKRADNTESIIKLDV